MKFAKNKAIAALIAAVLCLGFLLSACDGGKTQAPETDGGTSAQDEQTTLPEESSGQPEESENQTQDGESGQSSTQDPTEAGTDTPTATIPYTIHVIGSDGKPRRGALVSVQKDGNALIDAPTAQDGSVTVELVPDTYEVIIKNLLGEKYDERNCTLTPDSATLTIQLCGTPTLGEEIYAYSPAADDYVAYQAGGVSEGRTYVMLKADDMTYFLFVSSRGGTFKISVDKALPVSIGYYGSTSFVRTESIAPEENNALYVDVYDDMVFNYAFVIGIRAEDASLDACELRIEYVSERETTAGDLPWVDLMPERELPKYTMGAGTVTDFAVDSAEIQLVYSESDGYYHVGDATGPVVLVNLANDSQYMDALTTVCGNMRLGVYVYDENGNLQSKDSYNEMIWAYNKVADGGYYPLDDTLMRMLKVVGDYMGWYDPASPMYLFEGVALEPANAYLFACVYLQ